MTIGWILSQFGNNRTEAEKQYKQFILGGVGEDSPWHALKGQIFLGTDSFIKKLSNLLKDKEILKEVPRVQRYATRPTFSELFTEEKLKNKKARSEIIYEAYVHYGYILKEIAEYLDVHYVTISRVIKRVEKQRKKE